MCNSYHHYFFTDTANVFWGYHLSILLLLGEWVSKRRTVFVGTKVQIDTEAGEKTNSSCTLAPHQIAATGSESGYKSIIFPVLITWMFETFL